MRLWSRHIAATRKPPKQARASAIFLPPRGDERADHQRLDILGSVGTLGTGAFGIASAVNAAPSASPPLPSVRSPRNQSTPTQGLDVTVPAGPANPGVASAPSESAALVDGALAGSRELLSFLERRTGG